MKNTDSIGQVAKTLNIAPSTLRYWDKEGLINFTRNQDNNYREISFQTIMDICNIIFYREISIPIKEIKDYEKSNIDIIEKKLEDEKNNIINQILDLENIIKKIDIRKDMIKKLKELKPGKFILGKNKFKSIYKFDFKNEEYAQIYLQNPYRIVTLIDREKGDLTYGIQDVKTHEDSLLREEDIKEKNFLIGLLKVNVEDTSDNNYLDFIVEAKKLGFNPGELIGNYLSSGTEDIKYDFYEGWLELL